MIKFSIFNFQFSKQRGLSLYELLMVMAVIAIVAAIAIPAVSLLPYWKLSSSTKAVLGKLRQAQEETVTTQLKHGVEFNPSVNPPTIKFIKNGSPDITLETVTLGSGINLAIDSAIANNPNGANIIFFSSDGGPDVNGNINLSLDTSSKTVNVSPAGVIKITQ